jgi:DNA polymerase I
MGKTRCSQTTIHMKYLIIDTSYLIFRSFFAYPRLTNEEEPTGAIFGFTKTVMALIKEYRPEYLIFAIDTPKPTWRHKVKVDYKAGRPDIDPSMVQQIPHILEWCQKITPNYAIKDEFEADDHIYTTCFEVIQHSLLKQNGSTTGIGELFQDGGSLNEFDSKNFNLDDELLIFSSDRDLYQLLVYPNVRFINTNATKTGYDLFGPIEFKAKYELEPIQWIDYKALVGDGSDNLSGLPGVGPKTATTLIQSVGSLYTLLAQLGLPNAQYISGSWAQAKYSQAAKDWISNPKNSKLLEKIKSNQALLNETHLLSMLQIVPGEIDLKKGYDLHAGSYLFEKYGLKSLTTMLTNTVGFENPATDALF